MGQAMASNRGSSAYLWLILAGLAIGLVATLVYKLWPLLHPPLSQLAALDAGCDLRSSPCEAAFAGGGRIRFGIEPRPIPIAAPLQLRVETAGLEVAAVEVDFAGADMYMGFNRVALPRIEEGRYLGQGMLPVCVRTRMTWEARVLIHTPGGILAAPFRFDTIR
jgi:hypothetical protein